MYIIMHTHSGSPSKDQNVVIFFTSCYPPGPAASTFHATLEPCEVSNEVAALPRLLRCGR